MAFTPQYQIGTPEYSQELAGYLNALSPDELLSLGDDFNVAGLARSDLASIDPFGGNAQYGAGGYSKSSLAYSPEELKILSKYRNIDSLAARDSGYGVGSMKVTDRGDVAGDRQRQVPLQMWGTRNAPDTNEPLYQYTDDGFERLSYRKPDHGLLYDVASNFLAPAVVGGLTAGLGGLAFSGAGAAGAGAGATGSSGGAGAAGGLAGTGSGVGAEALLSGGNFGLTGAGAGAASPLAGYSLLGGTGAAELGATIGAGGFGATNLMGGAGAAGATGGGMGFTDWLKSGLTDFSVKDALSIGGDLFGGFMAQDAASDASDAALGLQRGMYNQTRADYAPYRELGEDAVPLMRGYLGLDDMEAPPLSPLAKWEMQQGNQALGRAESARGISTGGGAASRATDLTTKVVGNDWMRQYGMILDTLNVGRGATTGGSSAANQYATNSGNLLMNQGQQDASFWQGLGGLPRAYQNLGIQRDMAQQGSPFVNNQQSPTDNLYGTNYYGGGYDPRFQPKLKM